MTTATIKYEKGAIVITIPYDAKTDKATLPLSASGKTKSIFGTKGAAAAPAEVLAFDPNAKINLSVYTK